MKTLGLLVPSRSRPRNITRLWDSMKATCDGPTTLLVGLDADDPERDNYPAGPGYVIQDGLRYVTAWFNHLAMTTLGAFGAIGTVGDDNEFTTRGWDGRIRDALTRQPFAFGNDEYPTRPPGSLSCHIFIRADVVRILGYAGPPEISHMYVDVAWYAWCLAVGHEYLDDVRIPHRHYTTGAPHDETYARSYAQTASNLTAWHAYSRRGIEDHASTETGGLNADVLKLGGKPFTRDGLAGFNARLNIPEAWPWGP